MSFDLLSAFAAAQANAVLDAPAAAGSDAEAATRAAA